MTTLPAAPARLAVAQRGSQDPVVSGRNYDDGRRRTAAEYCKRWWIVLICCLTVLGSSKTRLKELGQLRTAAVTNGGQPRTAVTDGARPDEIETRARSTLSHTNLRLRLKIYE